MTSPERTPEQRYADALESKTATCARCVYYHHGDQQCRRHAPSPAMMAQCRSDKHDEDSFLVWWPEVDIEDWCGEFREGDAGEFDGK